MATRQPVAAEKLPSIPEHAEPTPWPEALRRLENGRAYLGQVGAPAEAEDLPRRLTWLQSACEAARPPGLGRRSRTSTIPNVAVSLSARQEEFSPNVSPPGQDEPNLERPPDYADYRPARTTAEGGATMLLSGVFLAGAIVVLGLAVYTKLADVRTFGQIQNLLVFAVALLLIALYLLVWEIALRLIARSDD